MTKRSLPLLIIVLIGAPAAFAGIFVPLNYNGPGAYGSQWHTSVVVSNRSQSSLAGPGVQFRQFNQCLVPAQGCGSAVLSPGSTGTLLSDAPHGLYISSEFGTATLATLHI